MLTGFHSNFLFEFLCVAPIKGAISSLMSFWLLPFIVV